MITLQDLIERFGERELIQLTNEQPRHDSVIIESVIERAISDATSEAASYLMPAGLVSLNRLGEVVYLPSPQVPEVLLLKTCDIARYYLYDNGTIDIVDKRYDAAIKWLDKVKKDPTMLTGPKSAAAINDQSAHVIASTEPTYWSM